MVSANVLAVVQKQSDEGAGFRLIVNGREGDIADWGSPSFCTLPNTGEKYMAYCEDEVSAPEVYCLIGRAHV